MIKFFRKIRQKTLTENKFGKYLTYAIGEIILVVVGILIAISINNWNQKYKNDQLTKFFLLDFKHDLEKDVESLKERISINNRMSSAVDSILFTLVNKKDLSKEENLTFFMLNNSLVYESYFVPEKITLRQFEAGNNTSLLSSKELKNKLFEYYSENDRNEMNGEKSTQLYQHLFLSKEISEPMVSGDLLSTFFVSNPVAPNLVLNDLVTNPSYIWAIKGKKVITAAQTSKYEKIMTLAEDLIVLIDNELKK